MGNFNKIIFAFVLFFLALSVKSYSEIVNKVKVEGNERISLETIVIFGDITIGKNYETSDVNLLIKKLYETTFFSNISVVLENNKLSIVVTENSFINSIIFNGEKAKKYTERISELLFVREKTSFVSGNIKGDVNQSIESMPLAMDVALFIPLRRYLSLPDFIKDLKLGVGLFNPVTNSAVDPGQFIPTYSIDIKFSKKK